VIADIKTDGNIPIEVKKRAQIRFDSHRVNRTSKFDGKAMDFVRSQASVKRIVFENRESLPRRRFLITV
jgi:hypothetical protein